MIFTTNKVVSVISTLLVLIGFFVITEEMVFGSFVGLGVGLMYMVALYTTVNAIAEYDRRVVPRGKKHREKLLGINLFVLFQLLTLTILYFIDYIGDVHWLSLYFIIGVMILWIGYFGLSFVFDYFILNEDGFTCNYFLKLKKSTILYKDIKSIEFGKLMNAFIIKTEDQTAYVDVYLVNANAFLNEISKNTAIEIHQKAFEGLNKYLSKLPRNHNKEYLDYFK